jgi:putative ABC transport system ATP-binding protein
MMSHDDHTLQDALDQHPYAIELQGLSKQYATNRKFVLKDFNLKVPHGQFLAIMGPSGCGKSTLLNQIGAMDGPTEGCVTVLGHDLANLNDDAKATVRREDLGYVFQFFNLLPTLTVADNVQLPLDLQGMSGKKARYLVRASLKSVGIEETIKQYPGQLSGGQMQRVAIARATVHNPKLILADEPTGNLDSESGSQILDLLLMRCRELGATVVMVTHSEEAAMQADRLIHLKDGRIVEDRQLRDVPHAHAVTSTY